MHDPQFILAEAKACIKRGDRVYARKLVDGLLFQQANSEQVWLLLAELVDHENERADCLRQALAINPHNQVAQQNYDELLCRYPELVELDPARVAASLEIAAAKKVEAAKRQKKVRRLRKLRRQK